MPQGTPLVAVVMGSDSDWPVMQETAKLLKELQIPFTVRVLSAHRTPEEAAAFARDARKDGLKIVIAAAGALRTWPAPWRLRQPFRSSAFRLKAGR